MTRFSIVLCLMVFLAGVADAQPATQSAKKAPVAGEKNSDGLTATLVANKDTYKLDPAQSGKDFRDKVAPFGERRGGVGLNRTPTPPAVDLSLVITNTTNQNVTITLGGDSSQIQLVLQGNGAVSADNLVAMTREFRMGNPTTLAPGQSTEVKITSLAYGTRGISKYAYWTEPGDYTLSATLQYAIGETQGKVTSGQTTLHITKD